MSQNVKEIVAVAELSKYGVKTVSNEYVNWSKQIKEDQKARVVPGASFECDLFVSDSGKKYINAVLSQVGETKAPPVAPKAEAKPELKKEKRDSETMSKADWSAKDRSQLIGGLCHDAAQLTNTALTMGMKVEDVLSTYKVILDGVISLREGVK